MMTTAYHNPSQVQPHPGQPGGPQPHMQGHPGQPNPMMHMMQQGQGQPQHMGPQQMYQQQMAMAAGSAGGAQLHPGIAQQAMLVRQRQHQQLLQNGGQVGGIPGGMAFQNPNGGGPQLRQGVPNGMYPGGAPSGVPGANMQGFGGNPNFRPMAPHMQQQLHLQAQQQQQLAAVTQHLNTGQSAPQGSAHAPAMSMPPQQGPQMPMQNINLQQLAQQRAALQQHQQGAGGVIGRGLSILRLHQLVDHLADFNSATAQNDINRWRKFANNFFSIDGILRQQLINNQKNETKQFEITNQPHIARYYFTMFESGVKNIQISLEGARETALQNQCSIVNVTKATFTYWFEGGTHLVATGRLVVQFNQNSQIDLFDYVTLNHDEFVPRKYMNERLRPFTEDNLIKPSPGPKQMRKGHPAPSHFLVENPAIIPEPVTNPIGLTQAVQQMLENVETFSQMRELIEFHHSTPTMGPKQCLTALVARQQQSQQHQFQQHHMQQQAAAAAAAAAHSPAAGGGSPAPNHLQAPLSQPGITSNPGSQTSTATGSANTSPNQTNKRRRISLSQQQQGGKPSEEDDGGGGNINGAKVKQSPRGGAKRMKIT